MRLDLLLSLAPGGSKEEMLVEQEPEEDEQVQVMQSFFISFGVVQVFLLTNCMLFLQVGAKGAIDKTSKAADSGVSCSGAVGGEVSISSEYCRISGN